MKLFTIGFTKKDAKTFFGLLIKNNVKTVIDIRLNNHSHLQVSLKGTTSPISSKVLPASTTYISLRLRPRRAC